MATIQGEILDIAKANGYEGESPKTISEAVNALGTVMGGGGSGGSDALTVTFTGANGDATYTADKSKPEVIEAASSGMRVYGIRKHNGAVYYYKLAQFVDTEDVTQITFVGTRSVSTANLQIEILNYSSPNEVQVTTKKVTLS